MHADIERCKGGCFTSNSVGSFWFAKRLVHPLQAIYSTMQSFKISASPRLTREN